MRSDKEILKQTEKLARAFAEFEGYILPESFLFRKATDARVISFWAMACLAQNILTNTEPNDCEGYYAEEEK